MHLGYYTIHKHTLKKLWVSLQDYCFLKHNKMTKTNSIEKKLYSSVILLRIKIEHES